MKILFVIQRPQLRGAEVFACQLAAELIILGHTTDIAYLYDGQEALKSKFPQLRFLFLDGSAGKRYFDFKAFRKLSAVIVEGRYDVVQANAGDTLKYTVLSKRIFGWKPPLIYRNANRMSAFMKGRLHQSINAWFLQRCEYFISVSENSRQDLITIHPAALNRSVTIPIGTYGFAEIPAASINKNNEEPIFINIASLVPEKSQSFLIDVFKTYFVKYSRGYLWIVGDGSLRNALTRKVNEAGLTDRVTFFGYRSDVISLLKASQVLVMTSRIEGLPGVILESLACGVPVLTSDAGGIAEVIQHNENGFCLHNPDVNEYVTHMNLLVSSRELRDRFVKNGRQLIQQKFLMNHIAEKFIEVYRSQIAAPGR